MYSCPRAVALLLAIAEIPDLRAAAAGAGGAFQAPPAVGRLYRPLPQLSSLPSLPRKSASPSGLGTLRAGQLAHGENIFVPLSLSLTHCFLLTCSLPLSLGFLFRTFLLSLTLSLCLSNSPSHSLSLPRSPASLSLSVSLLLSPSPLFPL
jgi:hypothetical protein